MARRMVILVDGLDAMTNDFERLAEQTIYDDAAESFSNAVRIGFEGTQALVPVGEGDARRPSGSLRDSGRFSNDWDGEEWSGSVEYGTNDDVLPYAVWARWKHHRKTGVDFMQPLDDISPLMESALDQPWRDVMGDE